MYLLLGEFLINPDAESLEKGKEYYKIKIAKNIKKYYIVILIAVPLSTAIALLFTYQYKEEEQQQEIDTQDETNTERCIDKVSNNSIAQQSTVTNIYSHELSQAFKSKRLWICATLTFLISFIILLQLNTFKTIGTLNEVPVPYLTVTAAFSGIGLVAFGPIWGYISDKVRFNILIVIITAIGVIMGVSLGLTLQYKMDLSFCLLTSLGVICVAGLMNIMNPHIMKVFGIKYLMQLGGIINLSNGLSNVIGSIFAFVVSQVYSEKNQNVGYYILYGVGGVFSLLALMLSFCENDDEFFATHLINSVSKIVTEQPSIANSNDISKIPESNNRTYEEIKE